MPKHDSKPTARQLRYLRQLAEQTGTTFIPPATRHQASREIERLRQRAPSALFQRREDRQAVSRGFVTQRPAGSVRDDEISGYGSGARWAG